MEENSGEGGDDQGSGWMQVKKKHRSNSKFSFQGWVGGLSRKPHSNVAPNQPARERPEDSDIPLNGLTLSRTKEPVTPGSSNSVHAHVPEAGVSYLDKRVVSHDDSSKTDELPQTSNVTIFPKIKWGNLDDGALVHNYGNTDFVEIKFGDIGNDDNPRAIDIVDDSVSSEPKEGEIVRTVEESDRSLSPPCEEVKEVSVSSEDVKARIVNENVIDVSQEPDNGPRNENLEAGTDKDSVFLQDPESGSNENPAAASGGCRPAAAVPDDFSGIPVTGPVGPGGVEGGEGKERFRQRLWCFLFENLNRAVDELYLLCELECDVEQMKEAVLVLEEASSDFEELRSRVEEFEEVKKSSDNPPMTMKTEHRRPHALSWEVRRMTTSPHRAEILSSSLEAFRKIQHERAAMQDDARKTGPVDSHDRSRSNYVSNKHAYTTDVAATEPKKRNGPQILAQGNPNRVKRTAESSKSKREPPGPSELGPRKENNVRSTDRPRKSTALSEREKDRRSNVSGNSFTSMDAWKQKRNWEDILASPSARFSRSPGLGPGRKSMDRARARILHDKLMSPEKKKKTAVDLKREAEEKHARATRIRTELENERLQRIERSSRKLNRVSEWQAVRSTRLREGMNARHRRGETRHEAFLARVARRAGDETTKVNEVRFITSLNEENRKLMLLQKYQDSELRRAEKLKDMKSKQKEDTAREEAVLERKKLVEAEKLQRLAETQRKKEEAVLRREEERKASSAAREAKAAEQMRRREVLAKAQQEEAELLAQKLAERLRESEQRRKFYLEQIRERASMDFRDQSSRSLNKDGLGKSTGGEDENQVNGGACVEGAALRARNVAQQHSLKRRIKKIRQRLMAAKYELGEPFVGGESVGIGYRAAVGTARAKIGRWLQELQRHRQARKEGAASIGLVTGDIIKFLEGKDPELHAARQAGLLDFVASALPASHTSKPENCQVTIYFLRLLKEILSLPVNRSYFLAQNLLPPIIPMLAAALENFIKITASSSTAASHLPSKTLIENSDSISEVLDGFLWTVAAVVGHSTADDRQHQMQDGLIELVVAYQVVHRLRELFALYDRPQIEGSPFPSSILLGIRLLVILTSKFGTVSSIDWESCAAVNGVCEAAKPLRDVLEDRPLDGGGERRNGNKSGRQPPPAVAYLLAAISETGLVCLPSLLTAVLLQANNRLSSEQGSYVLPSNFEEVATGVLKVLNNLATIDINFVQMMLARPDLKMEFFHLMSYLLSHCTAKWGVATDQTGLLLLESLLLLGNFALLHPENQAVLRWGKSPTILHKVCDLPFVFFSDPELMPVLAATLVAACFGSEQNRAVVQQELSVEMLLSLLRSCKTSPAQAHDESGPESTQPAPEARRLHGDVAQRPTEWARSGPESTQSGCPESRRLHGDVGQRPNRHGTRTARVQPVRNGPVGNGCGRNVKVRGQKDAKSTRVCEETAAKHNLSASENVSNLMLHSRFPASFVDKAEAFFSTELS